MCYADQCDENKNLPSDDELDDEYNSTWYHRFLVYGLSDEEAQLARNRHDFYQNLGFRSEYDDRGNRLHNPIPIDYGRYTLTNHLAPKSNQSAFRFNPIIGWFEIYCK